MVPPENIPSFGRQRIECGRLPIHRKGFALVATEEQGLRIVVGLHIIRTERSGLFEIRLCTFPIPAQAVPKKSSHPIAGARSGAKPIAFSALAKAFLISAARCAGVPLKSAENAWAWASPA